ncbi:protein PML isoform X1 [Notechis scutatus]|uniref:Protein PML isoform X1 n=1 Tax=Notechis scutatus TaxID=8663 RepID=A0A6J1VI66_9SAUR|nr:protein PML isoform X1 [Notechis scutatus]
MEGDFQFLLCDRCQTQAGNPKLLTCLHTLCTECLEENKPIGQCPVCESPIQASDGSPLKDNLLFSNLQTKLNTYQKIVSSEVLFCNLCKEEAEFWCSECSEFLCRKCYEAHQWYLKQKSHESQRLADLKKETAQSFLEGLKKSCTLFCAERSHNNQVISIYCRGCRKPMCCSCALLDGEHYNAKLYSDIRVEIDNRKEELSRLKEELVEKKRSYESSHNNVHEQLKKLEKVQSETHEVIQKEVEDMVQWIQQKGEKLMEKVDQQLCQEQEEAKKKLACMEQILKQMDAGEQLVEKMDLFASDQEVIDMHPFIKESLERLKKEKLPVSSFRTQVENFNEVRGELQDLCKRVKGEDACGCTVSTPRSHSSMVHSESPSNGKLQAKSKGMKMQRPSYTINVTKAFQGFTTSIMSPIKRPVAQLEKSIQASPKMLKLEERECNAPKVSNQQGQRPQENVPRSGQPSFRESTPEPQQGEPARSLMLGEDSTSGICEPDGASIVISSSEDSEDDTA